MCSSVSRPAARRGQRAGAGLGLALVNRFLELHDGWVEIESDDAKAGGTLVRCHIPRRIHDGDRMPSGTRWRISDSASGIFRCWALTLHSQIHSVTSFAHELEPDARVSAG